MPGNRLTQSGYALQKKVESFGDLIFCIKDYHLTHISAIVIHYTHLDGIGYLLHSYSSTGLVLFKEFSEDLLFLDEV